MHQDNLMSNARSSERVITSSNKEFSLSLQVQRVFIFRNEVGI